MGGVRSIGSGEQAKRPRGLQAKWSRAVLARDTFCGDPFGLHAGRIVVSEQADHIRPLHTFPPSRSREAWALSNGQGLCGKCHAEKGRRER